MTETKYKKQKEKISDGIDIESYIKRNVVEEFSIKEKKVKYNSRIKQYRSISKLSGEEEVVRAFLLSKLVNELGYKLEDIELEKEYDIGRPKTNKPRIDIIVRDKEGNAFLYIELKSPKDFEKDKDEVIEKQLFNLASQEVGQGKKVKYLVLYTFEPTKEGIKDKAIIIDYERFNSFDKWKEVRDFTNEIPKNYGKALRIPYAKGGFWTDKKGNKYEAKELETSFSPEQLDSLRKNLHNVLWGGGGTDDNDIFASLVNIILAKFKTKAKKKEGINTIFRFFIIKTEKAQKLTKSYLRG
ncbi:type I restriction enzyme HsdR N-terminal domain-containing protein [Desulfonauticus submarinus]|jgi:type I restriction enzyme M protein